MTMPGAEVRRSNAALVEDAIHRHRALSIEGLLERLFTRAFSDLVYPLIWEDAQVDMQALQLTPDSRIVTIASGGCNILNYLLADPAQITAVDLNPAHIALNKLKIESVRRLPRHADFFALFGAADRKTNSDLYKRELKRFLDAETQAYWDARDWTGRRRITRFDRGFYRYGLLGTCIGMAHGVARLHGADPRRLLEARGQTEQRAIYAEELAPLFDRATIRWMLGHRAALYGLGIPPAQYEALLGDAESMADVVQERLRRLACDFPLQDNAFAWQAFNRSYAASGAGPLPAYLEAGNYERLRGNIDKVSIVQMSFTDLLAREPAASHDRYVLLDAQDWKGESALARLWAEITRTARPGARVIFRTAGTETILPGKVPAAILDCWHYEADRSRQLWEQDRSAIYGGFHLYVLKHGA